MASGTIITLGFSGGGGSILSLGFGGGPVFAPGYPLVNEIPRGRTGGVSADFSRRYTRIFQVILGEEPRFGGPGTAIKATGLKIGQPYICPEPGEFDLGACINDIDCREEEAEDGLGWLVTAKYGPWVPVGETPLLTLPELEINGVRFERIADYDWVNDRAVLNSAGDPFDPPVMADDSRTLITIVRNEATYDLVLADSVANTVNAGVWQGFAPRTVKASAPIATRLFHPDCGTYYRVRYEFELNRETWDAQPLDAGFRRRFGSGQLAIFDRFDGPIASPALLDGLGQPLAPGADPVFLTFGIYPEIDFAIFNLDTI